MVIAATRMHRSLVDFTTGSTDMCDTLALSFSPHPHYGRCLPSANDSFQDSGIAVVKAKRAHAAQIPLDRMDVTVHIVSEPRLARQTRDDDSCASVDEQARKKQNGLGLDDDLERGG